MHSQIKFLTELADGGILRLYLLTFRVMLLGIVFQEVLVVWIISHPRFKYINDTLWFFGFVLTVGIERIEHKDIV